MLFESNVPEYPDPVSSMLCIALDATSLPEASVCAAKALWLKRKIIDISL